MHLSRMLMKVALPGLLATASLVFQTAVPAGAAFGQAGAMTGWESPGPGSRCGFPQTGFAYSGATLYFRDVTNPVTFQTADVEIGLGAFLAAPQGAAPGGCQFGAPFAPMVPMPVPLASAKVGGSPCTLMGGATDVYNRVNNSASFTFNCGGTVWQMGGTQNICDIDPLGLLPPSIPNRSPECASPDAAGYVDPVVGGASSHFVVTYTHT